MDSSLLSIGTNNNISDGNSAFPKSSFSSTINSQKISESIRTLLDSNDLAARNKCEAELLSAQNAFPDFGVILAKMLASTNATFPQRQMVAILLKQYVNAHWSPISEKFTGPEVSASMKQQIKHLLIPQLAESNSKIRNSVAHVISLLAAWDWPEQWPELIPRLISFLTIENPNPDVVDGCLLVFIEFCHEITDMQISSLLPVLFPPLLAIFCKYSSETHSQSTMVNLQIKCIECITSCIQAVHAVTAGSTESALDGDMICLKACVEQVRAHLDPWLRTFVSFLSQNQQDFSRVSPMLVREMIRCISATIQWFPQAVRPIISSLITPIWSLFVQLSVKYNHEIISGSCLESSDLEKLSFSIFEFIQALVETPSFKSIFRGNINSVVLHLITFVQIPKSQENIWLEDPDQFLQDDDFDSCSYSVRIASDDLMNALQSAYKKEFTQSLVICANQIMADSSRDWRAKEACLFVLGRCKLEEMKPNSSLNSKNRSHSFFDFPSFLQNYVFPHISCDPATSPFLAGRAIWFTSQLAPSLPLALTTNCVDFAIGCLKANSPAVLRICAVQGLNNFFGNDDSNRSLQPFIEPAVTSLVNINDINSSEFDTLLLETLTTILGIDPKTTLCVTASVTLLFLQIWQKYPEDPYLGCVILELVESIGITCRDAIGIVQERSIPIIVHIFNLHISSFGCHSEPDSEAANVQLTTVAFGVEFLASLIKFSPLIHNELPPILIEVAFPSLVQLTQVCDDSAIFQFSTECMKYYIQYGSQQLLRWTDPLQNNGLHHVINVIDRLLAPLQAESAAMFVGRLIRKLIAKVPDIVGTFIENLLIAVLHRLSMASSISFIQELVLIFAQLANLQVDWLLGFLVRRSVTIPTEANPGMIGSEFQEVSVSALHLLMQKWCSNQENFHGSYDVKVSISALGRIYIYATGNHTYLNLPACDPMVIEYFQNNYVLQTIIITNDQSDSVEGTIKMTRARARSQGKSVEKTIQVNLLLRSFELLITELENCIDEYQLANDPSQNQSDSDPVDSEEENPEESENRYAQTNYDEENDEPPHFEEDEDGVDDPINDINLVKYISEIVAQTRLFYGDPAFCSMVERLNPASQKSITKIFF